MVFSFSSGIALPMPLLSLRIYMEQMRQARLVQDVVQAMVKDLQEFGHRPRFSTVTRRYMRAQFPSRADAVAAAERLTLMIGDAPVRVQGVDTDVEARGDPIDKGVALMLLAEHIGIGPEKTLTIGDGRTDLPTMQPGVAAWVGCPANSKPDVVERVIRRKGHVARADALTGVIEVIDAFASGVIVSQPPPGWKQPEADLGMPGLFSGQRVDRSAMKRLEVALLVGTLVVGILVAASFNLIPGGSVVMKPIGWLLERMARLLFL
jgi:phosphoserine phosphatase